MKIGDKYYCIKTPRVYHMDFYSHSTCKNKYYYIYDISNIHYNNDTHRVIYLKDEFDNVSLPYTLWELNKFFVTDTGLRKIKLKKLNSWWYPIIKFLDNLTK